MNHSLRDIRKALFTVGCTKEQVCSTILWMSRKNAGARTVDGCSSQKNYELAVKKLEEGGRLKTYKHGIRPKNGTEKNSEML